MNFVPEQNPNNNKKGLNEIKIRKKKKFSNLDIGVTLVNERDAREA